MDSTKNGQKCEEGIRFPANGGVHAYLSDVRHREQSGSGNQHKSFWNEEVPPEKEYELFSFSVLLDWGEEGGNNFGVMDPPEPLGTRKEVLAKFWRPVNEEEPWHGHPISPKLRKGDAIPKSVLAKWHDEFIISRSLYMKIMRQKV